jgi:hypothetical protein
VGVGKGQALLTQTVLDVLNAEAQSIGAPPVSSRTLEDWISEKLLSGPLPRSLGRHGSAWAHSPSSLKAALEVVRLKASDPKRRNAVLRIRLWLIGFEVPINRIAEDLESEFSRLLHRHFFRNPLRYDASGAQIAGLEKERERRRVGPLDPTLVDAGFELPRDDLLKLARESVSDPAGPSKFSVVLDGMLSPFLSENGRATFTELLKGVERYVDPSGLFGARDEIERSGLEALAATSQGDLLKGRRLYEFALAMADCAARGNEFLPAEFGPAPGEAFAKIARSLRESDEWSVAGLAVCSIAARRARDAG